MSAEQALSWALLHFFWQGAVVALGVWLAMGLLRAPRARYVAATSGLALMALAPVVTFCLLWGERLVLDVALPAAQALTPRAGGGGHAGWLDLATLWMPRLWWAGSTLLLARAAVGWWLARRGSRTNVRLLDEEWRSRAEVLRQRLGVERAVDFFASFTVAGPQVFGWLRPVVLVPVSALMGLSAGELEALIAHELAHVRRHDYVVNLLQTVIESLLFYHPAVWWVSARVRTEREACCDEMAVEACGDRMLYGRALLKLEQARTGLALAASGGGLKERIERILGMRREQSISAPALAVAAFILICAGLVWARSAPPPPPPPPMASAEGPAPPAAPSPAVAPVVASAPEPAPAPAAPRPTAVRPPEPPPAPPPPPPVPGVRAENEPSEEWVMIQRKMAGVKKQLAELEIQSAQSETGEAQLKAEQAKAERKAKLVAMMRDLEQDKAELERTHGEAVGESKRAAEKAQQTAEKKRRVEYADQKFGAPGQRGSETDRGKVYIKFGPPNEIETHPESEDWRYSKDKIVHFDGNGKLVPRAQ